MKRYYFNFINYNVETVGLGIEKLKTTLVVIAVVNIAIQLIRIFIK